MGFPRFLRRHTVTVEAYLGSSAYGPRYAAGTEVTGLLERSTRVVRDQDGNEVTASATFRTSLDALAVFSPESRVTLPDGHTTRVIGVAPHDGGGLPTPDHLEVTLE